MDLLIGGIALAYLLYIVTPDAQGDALCALKKSLKASHNQLADWNPDQVNPCTWFKITCNSNNDVISVTLPNMGFSGTLSPRLSILKMLTTLKLPGNGTTGKIPEEFGNSTSLTMLDLENNNLSGEISSSLGNITGLKFLILSENNLSGSIPESLSSLSNLTDLKSVALGTARALEYLHEHCNPEIIHRDVKAANVLLDADFQAIVGDFGLGQLVDVRKTNITTQVRGTMGHIAPEYLSTGKSSEKTDVFGYGIMLLELATGQRAIDFSRLEDEDDVLLLDYVKKLQQENRLEAIVDINSDKNFNSHEVDMMVQVALLCTQSSPEDRPVMSEVVRMLEGEGLVERWELWQHVEITRRLENERLQRRFNWGEGDNSIHNQEAIELSGGR